MIIESTPIPPYLLLTRSNRPIHRLRRYLVPAKWQEMRTLRRKLGFAGVVVGWPIIAAYFALSENRHYGDEVRKLTGQGRWRQFVEQWWIATWFGVAPQAYYKYGLFDPKRRASAVEYIHNQELSAICESLNLNGDISIFRDKALFDKACCRQGLPWAKGLAMFEDGRVKWGTVKTPEELPEADFFSKPTQESGGCAVRSWKCIGPDRCRRNDGREFTREQVFEFFADVSRRRSYVIQELLRNHPDIEPLSTGGLCTVRIITGRRLSGEIVVLAAIFKMVTKDSVADNFAAGGIACSVDDEGRLGSAAPKGPVVARLDRHPDTGNPITGTVLPLWKETRELCLRAHECLSKIAFVGWDVAITGSGPILVEGNDTPCLELLQKGTDCPVGDSLFGAFCLEYYDAKSRASASE